MDNRLDAIIERHGIPNIYISGVANPNWPEIKSQLLKGQTAYVRPDVVGNIFRYKLLQLEENLRAGRYFGGHSLVYLFFNVAFSYGEFPIFQMAVRLQNVNMHSSQAIVNFIDQFIKAEVPIRLDFMSMPVTQFQSYHSLVDLMMTHKCSLTENQNKGCKYNKTQLCNKGYDREDTLCHTFIDGRSIVQYRRRKLCDLVVVSHNPQVLLEWNGHITVEFIANKSDLSRIVNSMALCENKIFLKEFVY